MNNCCSQAEYCRCIETKKELQYWNTFRGVGFSLDSLHANILDLPPDSADIELGLPPDQVFNVHLHCKGGVRNMEGAFCCSFCLYQGKTAGQMKKHFYHRHASVKPLQCSYCPRRFVRSEHLKRHERSRHTKEKPYSCVLCGRMFASNAVLYQHQVAKHGRLTRNVQRIDTSHHLHLSTHMSWGSADLRESHESIVAIEQERNP